MEDRSRIALLETENYELKEEIETLFGVVVELKEGMNLLIGRYIAGDMGKQE